MTARVCCTERGAGRFRTTVPRLAAAFVFTLLTACASAPMPADRGGGIGGTGNMDPCAQPVPPPDPDCPAAASTE